MNISAAVMVFSATKIGRAQEDEALCRRCSAWARRSLVHAQILSKGSLFTAVERRSSIHSGRRSRRRSHRLRRQWRRWACQAFSPGIISNGLFQGFFLKSPLQNKFFVNIVKMEAVSIEKNELLWSADCWSRPRLQTAHWFE